MNLLEVFRCERVFLPLVNLCILKIIFLTVAILASAVSPSVGGNHASAINLDVKEFKLRNGMQFLVVERHTTPQIACRVAIRAGSALETNGRTGIAHLLLFNSGRSLLVALRK
jgi:hypothetical protein